VGGVGFFVAVGVGFLEVLVLLEAPSTEKGGSYNFESDKSSDDGEAAEVGATLLGEVLVGAVAFLVAV